MKPRNLRALLALLASAYILSACSSGGGGGSFQTLTGAALTSEGQAITGLSVTLEPLPTMPSGSRRAPVATSTASSGRFQLEFPRVNEPTPMVLRFDARSGSPRSTFQMRMNLVLQPDAERLELEPLIVPIARPGDSTPIHGLTPQTVLVPDHPGASLELEPGVVDFGAADAAPSDEAPSAPVSTGEISLVYMPREQVPGSLPGGQVSDMVFSIQPSGIRFEQPVPITLPNYDGFAPGERVPIMQVNPDTGEWEEVARGTVNEAGTLVRSDPGEGVRWGSCTGCCYPPCTADVEGEVRVSLVRDGAPINEPVPNAMVDFGGNQVRTDEQGRYRLENIAIGNCRSDSPPFRLKGAATWIPPETATFRAPLRVEKEVEAFPDQTIQVDFQFTSLHLRFLDDHNDGQARLRGGPSLGPVAVDTVVADNQRDAVTGERRGTSVRLDFLVGLAETSGLEVKVSLLGDQPTPWERGWLVIDRQPGNGQVGTGAPLEFRLETDFVPYEDLRTGRVQIRYVAPELFGLPDESRMSWDGRDSRWVNLIAEGLVRETSSGGEVTRIATLEPAAIRVVRPPLFFVHGTLSSGQAWVEAHEGSPDEFVAAYGRLLGRVSYEECTADYGSQHQAPVSVLWSDVLDELEGYRDSLLRNHRIAATRFDWLAHSYGGLVTREIIARLVEDPAQAQRVRRLVTFGVPHLGAAAGDRVVNFSANEADVPGAAQMRTESHDLVGYLTLGLGADSVAQVRAAIDATAETGGAPGTSVFTDAAGRNRLRADELTRGLAETPGSGHLIPWIKYHFVYGRVEESLTDYQFAALDRVTGSIESAGDRFIAEESARAGLPPQQGLTLVRSNHTNLVRPENLRHAFPFLLRDLPDNEVTQLPSPIGRGPVVHRVTPLVVDSSTTRLQLRIEGANLLSGQGPTRLRLRARRLRVKPYFVEVTVPRAMVSDTSIDFDSALAAFPPDAELIPGWMNVIVDGVPSNRMWLEIGTYLDPVEITIPGPVARSTPLGGTAMVELLAEHGMEELVSPIVLANGGEASFEVLSTQALPNGRTRSLLRVELSERGGQVELILQEGLGPRSNAVSVALAARIAQVFPDETCVGMPIELRGAGFGTRSESVSIQIGGIVQPVLSVTPDTVRFLVQAGTASGHVSLFVDGIPALDSPHLSIGEDRDRDGLPDAWESMHGLDPDDPSNQREDPDLDALTNLREYQAGTDPTRLDTDGGGRGDGEELALGLDARDPADDDGDSDGDGLDIAVELALGTDPVVADSDSDGLTDGEEHLGTFGFATLPLDEDTDDDGLSDGQEVLIYRTNPLAQDTDGDGRSDAEELLAQSGPGSDPLDSDSDDDGLLDGVEVALGTSPLDSDSDDDGLFDGDEVAMGTDPGRPDSDGDGLSDGLEVALGTAPGIADAITTIVGKVERPDGSPVPDALAWPSGFNLALLRASSASDGSLRISPWPASLSPVQVQVSVDDPAGGSLTAFSLAVAAIPGGLTDVGSILVDVGASSGTIFPMPYTPASDEITQLELADLDEDGLVDAAVANRSLPGVGFLAGRSGGRFAPETRLDLAPSPLARLRLPDLSGDGRADIVGTSGSELRILENQGGGRFPEPPRRLALSFTAGDLAVADLDDDGDEDLVLGDLSRRALSVVRNGGQLSLQLVPGPSLPLHPGQVSISDFDADGSLDLAVLDANIGSSIFLFRNQGTGTLVQAGVLSTTPRSQAEHIEAASLYANGRFDLVVGGPRTSDVLAYRNRGGFQFEAPEVLVAGSGPSGPWAIETADIEGDGSLEVLTSMSTGGIRVLARQGQVFGEVPGIVGLFGPRFLQVVDLDHDSVADLVGTGDFGANGIFVARGDGVGGFTSSSLTPLGEALVRSKSADVSGDGITDLLHIADNLLGLKLLVARGDGSFQPPILLVLGELVIDFALLDLEGDGDLDIACATIEGLLFFDNLGGGSFGPPRDPGLPGSAGLVIEAHDIDGDGRLDLVQGHGDPKRVSFARNLGNGTFAAPVEVRLPGNGAATQLAFGHFDADGRVDLAVHDLLDNIAYALLQTAPWTFVPVRSLPVNDGFFVTGSGLEVLDFDGNGYEDIVIQRRDVQGFTLLRSLGNGTFLLPEVVVTGRESIDFLAIDLDGDGIEELITTDSRPLTVTVSSRAPGSNQYAVQESFQAQGVGIHLMPANLDSIGGPDLLMTVIEPTSAAMAVVSMLQGR